MGNGASVKNNIDIHKQYGVEINNIREIDGHYYLNLERDKYKLQKEILKVFERENNFSHEKDSELNHDNHKPNRLAHHKNTKL